mmetsp:Transcript_34688/g.83817  ORF Transcript_34688/g.83817 Transcript_34688/m.83817 type:complete len:207 (-) Transcript_34688:62-682(-)
MRQVLCLLALTSSRGLLRREPIIADRPEEVAEGRTPDGGYIIPNNGGKPCKPGYKKVYGARHQNVFCTHERADELIPCLDTRECPDEFECRGEHTPYGGKCHWVGGAHVVHPLITHATCLADQDCEDGFICRKGPFGKTHCLMENETWIGCVGPYDCPEGMQCMGEGTDQWRPQHFEGGEMPHGNICIAEPKANRPEMQNTLEKET